MSEEKSYGDVALDAYLASYGCDTMPISSWDYVAQAVIAEYKLRNNPIKYTGPNICCENNQDVPPLPEIPVQAQEIQKDREPETMAQYEARLLRAMGLVK